VTASRVGYPPTQRVPGSAPTFGPFRSAVELSVLPSAGPWGIVVLASAWGLWHLRSELTAVPYLDDSSMHEQMVRFASTRITEGHLPLSSWFPYLGLGSPQFLHYPSLGAMGVGLIGTLVGPNAAFRWSLYLLWALWPISIYWSGRLFGLSQWTSASAAAVAPFLMSVAGIGFETTAYVWAGFGVWAQLCASWILPLAWGFTFRALSGRGAVLPAVLSIALTVALHFETGYMALLPLVIWPFLVRRAIGRRLVLSVIVGVGALLASAWVVYPLIRQAGFAAQNQVLRGTGLENGYGARTITGWLVTGRLFDNGRLPVVTCLVGVGVVVCLRRWRVWEAGRALLSVFVASLLLTFGRTTFGSLYDIVPGSQDVFIRRFQMGIQLAGILLAGVGMVALGRIVVQAVRRVASEREWFGSLLSVRGIGAVGCVAALVVVLSPAWTELNRYDAHNARNIALQAAADSSGEGAINQVLDYVRVHPAGRVYAGMPTNWGNSFLVGAVPVFKYLESQDIDEVGYTLRTASLMTDPEYYFDEDNPGDYPLFGIGYLILPESRSPPVSASPVMCATTYCLWRLPHAGYIHVYDTVGVLRASRATVGTKSIALLRSRLLSEGRDLTVAFNGHPAATASASSEKGLDGPAGSVVTEHDELANGGASAEVVAKRTSVVVLSASYDIGWSVRVDNHPARVEMVAPALVGVLVGPGRHRIVFAYEGFGSYDALFALSGFTVVLIAAGSMVVRRRQRVATR
jgi:hypothetical protein